LEDDDEAAMDAVVQELVDGDKSPAEGGAHHRDDPQKRFKRAVQRVIFINRFKDHGGGAGDDDTLNGLDAQASSVTGIEPRHRLASAGSVVGKGRSTKRSVAGKSVDAYIKNLVDLYEYAQTRVIDDKINKEKLPWHVIHPDSMIKTSWDIMTLVLVVYFAFMVPYRIGFDIPLTSGEQLFDVMSDVIFIIDLFVSFRTAFKEDGILVYSSGRMAESYMKSWFFIDILASFPIGWFMSGAETKVNKLFRMLRLFKLFRILRLIKLFPRIMAMVETSIKLNPSLLRFARSFIILFIIWHNIGCLYYFVAREEYGGVVPCVSAADAAAGQPIGEGFCFVNHCVCRGSDDASQLQVITDTIDGWYDPRSPDLWVPHFTLANAPLSTQYWQSLFWAVEVTTGIGDDIQPKSDTEVAFTVVMAVLGLVVYSVIIGSAASALQNLDADAATRRQTLETATNFMRARKVPPFFQKIIKDYYEHMWATPRDAEEVFADLPPSLRARLSIVINRDLVDRVPILQTIPADVYIRTVRRLDRATYLPGEYVARQGQGGECMFLIDRGRVDAVLPNGKTVFMTLYPGDFFGESSMLYGTLRDASFRAVDYLDLFIMDKSTFDELSVAAMGFVNEVRRVDAERQAARLRLELQSVAPAPSTDLTKNPGAAGATPGSERAAGGLGRAARCLPRAGNEPAAVRVESSATKAPQLPVERRQSWRSSFRNKNKKGDSRAVAGDEGQPAGAAQVGAAQVPHRAVPSSRRVLSGSAAVAPFDDTPERHLEGRLKHFVEANERGASGAAGMTSLVAVSSRRSMSPIDAKMCPAPSYSASQRPGARHAAIPGRSLPAAPLQSVVTPLHGSEQPRLHEAASGQLPTPRRPAQEAASQEAAALAELAKASVIMAAAGQVQSDSSPELQNADRLLHVARQLGWSGVSSESAAEAPPRNEIGHQAPARADQGLESEVADLFLRALRGHK
jgi:CRP-like cAMP-binding protein